MAILVLHILMSKILKFEIESLPKQLIILKYCNEVQLFCNY